MGRRATGRSPRRVSSPLTRCFDLLNADFRADIASLSSYSHRTLYFWIEGDSLGFVVENKDCDIDARGVLYPLDRVQWGRALDRPRANACGRRALVTSGM